MALTNYTSRTDSKMTNSGISRRTVLIGGSAGLAGLGTVAVGGGLLTQTTTEAEAQAKLGPQIPIEKMMETGELADNILGNADAKVTLIEYSSMTCPHCARFHTGVLGQFKTKYIDTGKVRYIVREFPLDNLATAAAMLARCAGSDKYFAFVDALYAQQEKWAFAEGSPVPPLRELAKQAGFTRESFDKCLKDQKLVDGILWIRNRGAKEFGVSATPSFYINGRKLEGSSSLESLSSVIDPLLNES